jgi:hypothetical protein
MGFLRSVYQKLGYENRLLFGRLTSKQRLFYNLWHFLVVMESAMER